MNDKTNIFRNFEMRNSWNPKSSEKLISLKHTIEKKNAEKACVYLAFSKTQLIMGIQNHLHTNCKFLENFAKKSQN